MNSVNQFINFPKFNFDKFEFILSAQSSILHILKFETDLNVKRHVSILLGTTSRRCDNSSLPVKRVKTLSHSHSLLKKKEGSFNLSCEKVCEINSLKMSETEAAAGLFSMPALQYNEEGWGPHEISEDFRVMPYQVHCKVQAKKKLPQIN